MQKNIMKELEHKPLSNNNINVRKTPKLPDIPQSEKDKLTTLHKAAVLLDEMGYYVGTIHPKRVQQS